MAESIHLTAAQADAARQAMSNLALQAVRAAGEEEVLAQIGATDARLAMDALVRALRAAAAGDLEGFLGAAMAAGDWARGAHGAQYGVDRLAKKPAAPTAEQREANIAAVELEDLTPQPDRTPRPHDGARVIVSYRNDDGEPVLTIAGPQEAASYHEAQAYARTHFAETTTARSMGVTGFRIGWRD